MGLQESKVLVQEALRRVGREALENAGVRTLLDGRDAQRRRRSPGAF